MKEYKIEIEIDEKGNISAETFGMQGNICEKELDKILEDVKGEQEIQNTDDYYKKQQSKQTIKRG